jgi:predicted AlkP superfamily phosphohydrolase/phosphomutase
LKNISNKEINKVIILGIDALEYKLVEDWNLKNLKQKEYGKIKLPLYPGREPATEIIWPCFITGKEPKEMGYSSINIYSKSLKPIISLFSPVINKLFIDTKTKDGEHKIQGRLSILYIFIMLLKKIGLIRKPSKEDIKAETIFENKKLKSIHLHMPVYDKDDFPDYRKELIKIISKKEYKPVIEIKQKKEFKKRSKEVFDYLNKKDWDIFMQYFYVLDGVQHIFYNNSKKVAQFYLMFDEFVEKVSKKIDEKTLLLVVSDHGQLKGIHTTYGFYSLNKKLGLINPRLIDFKPLIEKLLGQ